MESSANLTPLYAVAGLLVIVVVLALARYRKQKQWGRCRSRHSLKGKTFVVTGASCGIGFETARSLAGRGARVVFACRDEEGAKKAVQLARSTTPAAGRGEMLSMPLDLSSLESIKQFVERVKVAFEKVDVLINNAGVSVPLEKGIRTKDGFEINFGVNYLGHFLLTNLLLDRLERAAPSRVVVVSSMLHEQGYIDLKDLNMEKKADEERASGRKSNGPVDLAYCNSKLMNVYFGKALAQRTSHMEIDVHTVCPGFAYSKLFRHTMKWYHFLLFTPIFFFVMKTSKQAAQTVLHCATEESLKGRSGGFYANCKPYELKISYDKALEAQLWRTTEGIIEASEV